MSFVICEDKLQRQKDPVWRIITMLHSSKHRRRKSLDPLSAFSTKQSEVYTIFDRRIEWSLSSIRLVYVIITEVLREQERYMPIRSLYIANDESKNSFLNGMSPNSCSTSCNRRPVFLLIMRANCYCLIYETPHKVEWLKTWLTTSLEGFIVSPLLYIFYRDWKRQQDIYFRFVSLCSII